MYSQKLLRDDTLKKGRNLTEKNVAELETV